MTRAMSDYIETYEIPSLSRMGIDDCRGQKNPWPSGRKRFHCWSNGCGIGGDGMDTLPAARQYLYNMAVGELSSNIAKKKKELSAMESAFNKLHGGDVFNLGRFLVNDKK